MEKRLPLTSYPRMNTGWWKLSTSDTRAPARKIIRWDRCCGWYTWTPGNSCKSALPDLPTCVYVSGWMYRLVFTLALTASSGKLGKRLSSLMSIGREGMKKLIVELVLNWRWCCGPQGRDTRPSEDKRSLRSTPNLVGVLQPAHQRDHLSLVLPALPRSPSLFNHTEIIFFLSIFLSSSFLVFFSCSVYACASFFFFLQSWSKGSTQRLML